MMGGNPNWWSHIHSLRSSATVYGDHDHQPSTNDLLTQTTSIFPLQFVHGSSSLPFDPLVSDGHEFPHSWSQLLLGGLASHEEDRLISASSDFQPRKLETWEEHINPISATITAADHLKKEASRQSNNSSLYCCHEEEEEEEIAAAKTRPTAWTKIFPASSPKSCVTSLSSNILDFSNNGSGGHEWNQQADISSECNSTATGGVAKKVRVQSSSTAPLKVRKEKLGDRITALHRLVSPFGKTDTASVLLEAIGCIRFLQAQIQALSAPYLGNAAASSEATHHPECNKGDAAEDLRSKGLCLVPISCTQLVASDNEADYWAPSLGGGFFT